MSDYQDCYSHLSQQMSKEAGHVPDISPSRNTHWDVTLNIS